MDVPTELNRARQFLQVGRAEDAKNTLKKVLESDPSQPDTAYLLGMIFLQSGDAQSAAPHMETAARGWPNNAEAQVNLGHCLRAVGRFDDAAVAVERAIAIRPDFAQAYNNLGLIRRSQGRLKEAEAAYREALAIIPNLVPANFNLANLLHQVGRYAEAVTVYHRLNTLAPSNPDTHTGLAMALDGINDHAGAKASFERAIQLEPRHVPALANLGLMLKRLGKIDEALVWLQRAVEANPRSADAQEKYARALWDSGRYDEGVAHFEEAVRLRPTPETRVSAATLVPPVFTSVEAVGQWRERLVREVGKLRAEGAGGVKVDLTDHIARSPFYVVYSGLDDRDVLREIAELYQPPPDAALSRGAAGGRVRVGFISAFLKDHTVGLWTQGLIARLPRDKFEIIGISTFPHADDVARFIRGQCDRFIDLPSRIVDMRSAIANLGLDVLIYADLGMEGITYTLAFSRLAPVQCVMWGHPSTSGISTIDFFLSSELAEAEGAEANYTEKLVRFKNLPLYYYRPPQAPPRMREDFKLPADAHVYGCLHSTFKLHPQFDFVLGELLRRDASGILLIPKTGSANWDRMVLGRLRATYPDVVERIRFFDRLARDEFRGLTKLCDATLAPFPFGAGDTSMETLAAGVPVVTMPTKYLRGNFTAALYRVMGVEECIAKSPEEYVEICLGLANDKDWRDKVVAYIETNSPKLFEDMRGVNELAEFLSRSSDPSTAMG